MDQIKVRCTVTGRENSARRRLIMDPPPQLPCCLPLLLLPPSAAGGQCPKSSAFDCKGGKRMMYYKVEVERKKIQFLKEQ